MNLFSLFFKLFISHIMVTAIAYKVIKKTRSFIKTFPFLIYCFLKKQFINWEWLLLYRVLFLTSSRFVLIKPLKHIL